MDLGNEEMRKIINLCGHRALHNNVSLLCSGACTLLITTIDFIRIHPISVIQCVS